MAEQMPHFQPGEYFAEIVKTDITPRTHAMCDLRRPGGSALRESRDYYLGWTHRLSERLQRRRFKRVTNVQDNCVVCFSCQLT